jgi:hypothetical protein
MESIMHNLHFLLINADSAADAASETESLILDWGNENNWRSVGGIASEDGSDDVENKDDGCWGLSFLDEEEGIPKEGSRRGRQGRFVLTRRCDRRPRAPGYGGFQGVP